MLSRVNSPAARIMPTAISVPGGRSRSSACRSPPSCGPMPGAPARTGRGRPVVPAGGSVTPLAEAGASPAADSDACVPSKVPGADAARRVVGGSAFARAVFAVVESAPAFAAVEPAPAFARVRLGAAASVAAADGVAAFAVLPRRAVPDRFGFAALVPSDDALAGDAAPAVFVLDAVRRARGLRAGVSAVSAAAVPAAVSAGAGAVALDALAPVEAVAAAVLSVGAGSARAAGAAGAAAGPPGSVASPAAGSADPPGPDGLGAPDAGAGARMDSGSLIATVGASGPDASGAGPPGAAAAAAFATSRVRAAPARPRPIRSGRVEGSAPSTLFSVFFGFAGFFFCLSGFSAIRCECTVQSGHGARSPSDTGQETTICVPASYAVVASWAIDDPKPNS